MSDTKYCSISYHANQISYCASAADWEAASAPPHDDAIRTSFHALADLLGYTVKPKEPPPASVYYDEGDLE